MGEFISYMARCLDYEQFLGDGQKPAVHGLVVVLQEAREALDHRFLAGAVAGSVISNDREMGVFATSQSTDQSHQRIEVLFAMTSWARLIDLSGSQMLS